jgi:LysM repeat protein
MRKAVVIAVIVLAAMLLTAASPGQAQAGGPVYHVVRPGQTLSAIASMYGVSTWALAYMNGLWNPSLIYVGQVLVIPYPGYVYHPYPYYYPNPVVYYPRPTFGCSYWVRYGDTMITIARRFGGDPWAIARANGIYNLNWIYAGQRLYIPGCN